MHTIFEPKNNELKLSIHHSFILRPGQNAGTLVRSLTREQIT